jgi:hypothetical protein
VVKVPHSQAKVRRTHVRRAIDVTNQITYPELIYYVQESNGSVTRHVEKIALKYYYEDQLRELLLSQRFIIKEQLGYYDGRPIEEGPEFIFVCAIRIFC